ncbi:MAG: sensor histidine kinase [Synergistaceae bacterium]|nr:sensor histidine kinase [Synergistaceae bacterium]
MIYANTGFTERILNADSARQGLKNNDDIRSFLFSILSANRYLFSIYLHINGNFYGEYRVTRRYSLRSAPENFPEWSQNIDYSPKILHIYSTGFGSIENTYVTIGRRVRFGNENGILLMDVDIQEPLKEYTGSFLNNPYVRRPDTDARGSFIILSGKNGIVVQTDIMEKAFAETMLTADTGRREITTGKETYLILSETVPYTDWTIYYYMKKDSLLRELHDAGRRILTVMSFVLAGAVILFRLMVHKLSKRLNAFLRAINCFKSGRMEITLRDDGNDEISTLVRGFNDMSLEIRRLIQEVYKTQIRQKEAELSALRAQINPHFIYNTLQNIQMLAIIEDQRGIASMVADFGKLIRRSLEEKGDYITVENEFGFLETYCKLMRLRFENGFSYHVDIESAIREKMILKFTLQPLVENAIVHGLAPANRLGEINVKACQNGAYLEITIRDNGVGMNVNANTSEGKPPGEFTSHIGIRNVHDRIRLAYGENYGLHFASVKNEWTEAKLVLPIINAAPSEPERNPADAI